MVSTAVDNPDPRRPDDTGKTPRKAVIAGWIGSFLEYYDFFIYGTAAALVFGKVFFPTADPTTGTLLSLATYGVAYVARPVGSIFMGHLGDRYGRKRVLVLTVTLMGLATFLVGCLPSYNSIGLAAPILLVALRLLQGLAASGEQAGANSLSLEHAPGGTASLPHQLHARRHPGRPCRRHRAVAPHRQPAREPARLLGMAAAVLAERRRHHRRSHHPQPAHRGPGVPAGRGRARAVPPPAGAAPRRPLAQRRTCRLRRTGLHRLDDRRRVRAGLRGQDRRAR